MSKVKIQGHASGTGVLTVTAPNTSTDRTITLPDSTGTILDENSSLPAANLTGTVADARISTLTASKLTGALPALDGSALTGISGGKILQVKYAYWFPSSAYTISNADELSNLNITMTPTSSSSKLISTVSFGMLQQSSTANYIEVRYNKDSTAIDGGSYGLGYSEYEGTYMSRNYKPHHYTLVHDASDTSSRTYKIIMNTGGNWKVHNGAGNTHIIMEYEV
jgi:hypothetical protein